jgi:hypothetical protein
LSIYGGDVEFEGGIARKAVTEAWGGHLGYRVSEGKGEEEEEEEKKRHG